MALNYRTLTDLTILTSEDLEIVEQRAKALSIEQCLEYLCLTNSDLTEQERKYVNIAHRRGVADGIYKAVDYLFRAMQGKNGGQAAVDFLRTCSEPFQVNATPTAKSGFSFVVDMGNK